MSKKGISPLLATVLIIGLTISIASMVIIWGKSMLRNVQEETEFEAQSKLTCAQNVELQINSICSSGKDIELTVENLKQQEITGFDLRLTGSISNQIAHEPPYTNIGSSAVISLTIPHSPLIVGDLEEIGIIPKIKLEDQVFLCPEKIITLENIPNCT